MILDTLMQQAEPSDQILLRHAVALFLLDKALAPQLSAGLYVWLSNCVSSAVRIRARRSPRQNRDRSHSLVPQVYSGIPW